MWQFERGETRSAPGDYNYKAWADMAKMEENEKKLKFLTMKDLMRLFGCHRSTIYHRIHDGTLPPPIKFGRLVRWRQDELEKWFDNLYEPVT